MNKTFNNKRQILYLIIIIIGILLVSFASVTLVKQNKYYKHGEKVVATVDNILDYPDANSPTYEEELKNYNQLLKEYRKLGIIKDTTRVAIIINYNYNNKSYTTELGYFSADFQIAQNVNIFVNKNDATDFLVEGRNQFGIIVNFVLGGVFILAGLLCIFVARHNSKCNSMLLKNGKIIEAEVLYVDVKEGRESFGRHPNVFTCVYKNPETNQDEYFSSDCVYSKNEGTTYIGKKVKIFIDPNDNKNYYVDISKFEKE